MSGSTPPLRTLSSLSVPMDRAELLKRIGAFNFSQIGKFKIPGKPCLSSSSAPSSTFNHIEEHIGALADSRQSYSLTSLHTRTKELKRGKAEIDSLGHYIRSFLGDTIEDDIKELAINTVLESMVEQELAKYPIEKIELLAKVDEMRRLVGHPLVWSKDEGSDTYFWKDDRLGFHVAANQEGALWKAVISIKEKEKGKYKPKHTIEGSYGSGKSIPHALTEEINRYRVMYSSEKVAFKFKVDSPDEKHFLTEMTAAIKEGGRGIELAQISTTVGSAIKWPVICAGLDIAGCVALPLDAYRVYSAKRKLTDYKELKIEIEQLKQEGKIEIAKLLTKQAESILRSAAGKLFFSLADITSTTMFAAAAITQLAYGTIVPNAMASTAIMATGAAAGGVLVASSLTDLLVNTFRFYKKSVRKELLDDLQKNLDQVLELAKQGQNESFLKKCECMHRFLKMQKDVLNEKMLFNAGDMGVDVAMCTIGTLLIVASVTGAASAGIGAAAVAGGVVLGISAMVVTDHVRKKRRKTKEKERRIQDPQNSNLGIIAELSSYLAEEVQNPGSDQSVSKFICGEYLKVPPYLVVAATKELVARYRLATHHHLIA